MAKIILSMDGVVLQEMLLSKERITIGRRPHNDLVIDNSAVSAEHAVIVTMLRDAFLEDLNSTNGTRVNGQPVKKHFLKNNDVIELAKYRIRFIGDETTEDNASAFINVPRQPASTGKSDSDQTAAPKRSHRDGNTVVQIGHGGQSNALLKIMSGPNSGKEIALTKPLTTIGLPGLQVAVVTRRAKVYSITHVEGNSYPLLNGKSIGTNANELAHGDVIELADTRMQFVQL